MGSSKLSCGCDALERHFWHDGSDSFRLLESCSAVEMLSWNIWPQTAHCGRDVAHVWAEKVILC